MRRENNSAKTGIGFSEALTLMFITLKLCGVINWSWLWVLSPVWISIAIFLVVFAIIVCLDR